MDPMTVIAGISATVKAAGGVVSLLKDSKDLIKKGDSTSALDSINSAQITISDALDKLLEAKTRAIELLDENQVLKQQILDMEDWKERKINFELITTDGGATVYKHKGDPPYFACPACFEKKEVQKLQDRRVITGHFDCPNPDCKAQYPIKASVGLDVGSMLRVVKPK